MNVPDLLLDPSLAGWVLFPISLVMLLVGVIRNNVTFLLRPKLRLKPIKEVREQHYLMACGNLRNNHQTVTKQFFENKKSFFLDGIKKGSYLKDPSARGQTPANPLTDPKGMDGMMEMMKGNIAMIVPQTLMMSWINSFFAGFVLMKLPFPLTVRFKSMLQSGVMTQDLDVRWVSSISWYFLNLIGLKAVFALILGEDNAASEQMGQQQNMGGFQPGVDVDKIFQAEGENLNIVQHVYVLDGIENRVLVAYGL